MPHSLPETRIARPSALASLQALAATYAARAKSVIHAVSNRLAVQRLDELPDHHLADIGLTREDLHFGRGLPLDQDPSLELARRARMNRFRSNP